MSAVIIDGKQVAADVRAEVANKVSELKKKGIAPCLAVILVGENPASVSYVTGKQKALAEVGMVDRSVHLPESTSEEELLKLIDELNADDSVHGRSEELDSCPKHPLSTLKTTLFLLKYIPFFGACHSPSRDIFI